MMEEEEFEMNRWCSGLGPGKWAACGGGAFIGLPRFYTSQSQPIMDVLDNRTHQHRISKPSIGHESNSLQSNQKLWRISISLVPIPFNTNHPLWTSSLIIDTNAFYTNTIQNGKHMVIELLSSP